MKKFRHKCTVAISDYTSNLELKNLKLQEVLSKFTRAGICTYVVDYDWFARGEIKKEDRNIEELKIQANTIRKDILKMIFNIQSGHLGGSFSMVEMLTALYFDEMHYDPKNPSLKDRDRFILSKGHTAPALYATLANAGYFPKEKLMTSFRRIDSMLQGHPDMKKTPGVEMTSGSLGIGLSAANGMALGNRLQGIDARIYCMMGDGEINEGQIWEAAATASYQTPRFPKG